MPRFHRLAGLALVAWLLWELTLLSVLGVDPTRYNRFVEVADGIIPRLLVAAAVLALTFHALDGVRLVLLDFGASPRFARASRVAIAFVVSAMAVPVVALVLRSRIEGWLS